MFTVFFCVLIRIITKRILNTACVCVCVCVRAQDSAGSEQESVV
jgi:hypothetical protein